LGTATKTSNFKDNGTEKRRKNASILAQETSSHSGTRAMRKKESSKNLTNSTFTGRELNALRRQRIYACDVQKQSEKKKRGKKKPAAVGGRKKGKKKRGALTFCRVNDRGQRPGDGRRPLELVRGEGGGGGGGGGGLGRFLPPRGLAPHPTPERKVEGRSVLREVPYRMIPPLTCAVDLGQVWKKPERTGQCEKQNI